MGIMEVIIENLREENADVEVFSYLLVSLRNLFEWGEVEMSSKHLNENPFVKMFEELGGLTILEQNNCWSEEFSLEIENICEIYF